MREMMLSPSTHTDTHGVKRQASPCRHFCGQLGSLVVKADANIVRIRATWKSKVLINTDDSAPFPRAMMKVHFVVLVRSVCVFGSRYRGLLVGNI